MLNEWRRGGSAAPSRRLDSHLLRDRRDDGTLPDRGGEFRRSSGADDRPVESRRAVIVGSRRRY
jgi:hypothetical protein